MTRYPGIGTRSSGATVRRPRIATVLRALLLGAALIPGRAVAANPADLAVTVHHEDGAYRVNGVFTVEVSRAVAWDVLTDYEGIGGFVGSVRRSVMERGPDGQLVLRQDAVAGPFPFKRRMQVALRLDERAQERIAFRDVLERDFHRYDGEWTLMVDGAETQIHYNLEAEPRTSMPKAIGRSVLMGIAKDLLTRVRLEMLRRGGLAAE
jgi:hypothetical protein